MYISASTMEIGREVSKKKQGGVTQVVEHLPGKYKALSSNPRTVKNNPEKQNYSTTPGHALRECKSAYKRHLHTHVYKQH
jgi:hypothetical protein